MLYRDIVRDYIGTCYIGTLLQVVEDFRSKQEDVSRLPSNEAQNCPTHSRALSVYCETCRNGICYECALFSGQHKEHSFQPLDKLHKKHKLAVENELHKLKDRMRDILSFVLQVEKRVDGVRMSKSKVRHACTYMYMHVTCTYMHVTYTYMYMHVTCTYMHVIYTYMCTCMSPVPTCRPKGRFNS